MAGVTETPLRVMVVEDDNFTRTTLCGALRNEGVRVVADIATAEGALDAVVRLRPDAALVDLDLGGGPTGADFVVEARRAIPTLGIVFLTSYEDPRLAGQSLDQLPTNARYLIKRDLSDARLLAETLARSVEAAHPGTTRAATARPLIRNSANQLTDAQVEILRLVADGLSNAEIARRRFVSEKSVERILLRIARELDIPTETGSNRRVLMTREYMRMSGMPDRHGNA